MDIVFYVAVIFVCILLSAFFSGSETALLRLRPEELDTDIRGAKGPGAVAAKNLLRSPSRLLVTILLGNNVVNILAASCASALAIGLLGERMGLTVATITMTVLILLFSEILPKAIAARDSRRVSYLFALPLYLIHHLLIPFHVLFDRVIDPIVKKITKGAHKQSDSTEQLLTLAKQARQHRVDGSPVSIIAGAAEASEMTVSEIMIPRSEIVAFPVNTSVKSLITKMVEENHARVPIYSSSLDQILGIVHIKDLVKLYLDDKNNVTDIIRPVLRVPGRKPILPLLSEMQRGFIHMAIVKDEFGVTSGSVTQEDILEEIVGEIRDEFDKEELETIKQFDDSTYDALGRVHVLDFNRETDWELEAEKGDTLAGLVFNLLGRAAKKGEEVHKGNYKLTVLGVSANRITRVRVQRLTEV